ncbi:Gfo/Idh/MocA family protein [Ferruginibacter sp.]|jgi:predicted dehydrogenase|uniref:Gfo/Idh/MocA family protein n=1 Tax=Ferruginibacter sp. TaxID=1940288 RepID=UPI002659B359|nr:Gfo/Idh/MocA family oxidoreductase [Ferruginibacter sp.]
MKKIKWGIIGCGDVTEKKSGPAFNKVSNSMLVAVMRRNADKAKDYAQRHNVPKWYTNGEDLINDPEVNAVYIATPPSSHEMYCIAAINAGKPVYVEKPMSNNTAEAWKMANLAAQKNVPLAVAHYRRQQPFFKKIKQLIEDEIIGAVHFVQLQYCKKALTATELLDKRIAWRVDPSIAGGGLFHDLAPHQLDLMHYFFGEAATVHGVATNNAGLYAADDTVAGNILFKNGVVFNGIWSFGIAAAAERDWCEITGSRGTIGFSVFDGRTITITINDETEQITFDALQHVQQPMIAAVVEYFSGGTENPCSAQDGALIMQWMEAMTRNS